MSQLDLCCCLYLHDEPEQLPCLACELVAERDTEPAPPMDGEAEGEAA